VPSPPFAVAEPAPVCAPVLSATDAPVSSQAFVEALLQRVHEERVAIGSMLEQAIWIQPVEDTLRIVFSEKHAFFRDKVQSREVTDYLRRAARELSGRDLRVVVETGAAGAFEPLSLAAAATPMARPVAVVPAAAAGMASPPPTDARRPAASPAAGTPRAPLAGAAKPARPIAPLGDAERQALRDRAMQDLSVRSMLDLFGGEIVDVEPV